GYPGHPDLVEGPLAGGRIAVDVSDIGLTDLSVIQPGVFQRDTRCARCHFRIRLDLSRFHERYHTDTRYINLVAHLETSFLQLVLIVSTSDCRGHKSPFTDRNLAPLENPPSSSGPS